MARPFDARSLVGRTFGSVLDRIAPGWDAWGFGDGGPLAHAISFLEVPNPVEEIRADAEIRRKLAPIIAALCERAVVLIDAEGAEVPLWVWLSGRWTFYRDENGRECLKAVTAAGQPVEYYSTTFADPVATATRVAAEPQRTGTAGRPTSWHLIEAECRRRYIEEGERYSSGAGENATEWARVLLEWLRKVHPTAPQPTLNTARTKLPPLLRALKGNRSK